MSTSVGDSSGRAILVAYSDNPYTLTETVDKGWICSRATNCLDNPEAPNSVMHSFRLWRRLLFGPVMNVFGLCLVIHRLSPRLSSYFQQVFAPVGYLEVFRLMKMAIPSLIPRGDDWWFLDTRFAIWIVASKFRKFAQFRLFCVITKISVKPGLGSK